MVQPLNLLVETPSQTAGPYVHIGCIPTFAGIEGVYPEDLGLSPISEGAKGQIITVTGTICDGTGWAMRDAMLESWQADATGRYSGQDGADPAVSGFCRFAADKETGEYTLRTVKPGSVLDRNGRAMAPISRSGSSLAGSISACIRASTSRTSPRTTTATRCSPGSNSATAPTP